MLLSRVPNGQGGPRSEIAAVGPQQVVGGGAKQQTASPRPWSDGFDRSKGSRSVLGSVADPQLPSVGAVGGIEQHQGSIVDGVKSEISTGHGVTVGVEVDDHRGLVEARAMEVQFTAVGPIVSGEDQPIEAVGPHGSVAPTGHRVSSSAEQIRHPLGTKGFEAEIQGLAHLIILQQVVAGNAFTVAVVHAESHHETVGADVGGCGHLVDQRSCSLRSVKAVGAVVPVPADDAVAQRGLGDDFVLVEDLVFVEVESAVHRHPTLRAGAVLRRDRLGREELNRCVFPRITGLTLRAGQATQTVADGGRVLTFTFVEDIVTVDVKARVDVIAALVARCNGLKGFGFNQPWRGGGLVRGCADEGVVVGGEQEHGDQRQGLDDGQPASMAMWWMVWRGLFVLRFMFWPN